MNNYVSCDGELEGALLSYASAVPQAPKFIKEAMQKGGGRDPKKHEIFVHPDFPYCEGRAYPSAYPEEEYGDIGLHWRTYRHSIAERLQAAESPIVLTYGGEDKIRYNRYLREWALPYSQEDTISTHTIGEVKEGIQVNGKMSFASFQRMMERTQGFNPNDEFVIHGADFADCVADAAEQLATLSAWNVFQPPNGSKEHQNIIRLALNMDHKIQNTRIRLGVVFDSRNTYQFLQKTHIPTAIQMHLVASDSKVIPSRDRS